MAYIYNINTAIKFFSSSPCSFPVLCFFGTVFGNRASLELLPTGARLSH